MKVIFHNILDILSGYYEVEIAEVDVNSHEKLFCLYEYNGMFQTENPQQSPFKGCIKDTCRPILI